MQGRHAGVSRGRWGLRCLGSVIALGVVSVLLIATPAHASGSTVVVTMGVTGATSSNCGTLSTGGSDVYVAPGDALDFKTTVAGINALGLKLGLVNVSGVANLSGALVIDGAQSYRLDASRTQRVTPLATGNHPYTFAFDTVTLASLAQLPLSSLLPGGQVNAGAQLSYRGTIHVTTEAARCGVSVQLPGPVVSASLPGLPPVRVSLPPVTVPTIPIGQPSGQQQPSGTARPSASPTAVTTGSQPTSATTQANGQGGGTGAPGTQPGSSGAGAPVPVGGGITSQAAAWTLPGDLVPSTAGTEAPLGEPGGDFSPVKQLPVLLAMLAIISLALVTGAYARMRFLGPRTA